MKLKSIDGKVPYIMAAGKDFVKDEMSLTAAEQICSRGTQTASKDVYKRQDHRHEDGRFLQDRSRQV